MGVKLVGADKLANLYGRATASGTVNELKQAIHGTAQEVLAESQKIVPVDLGTLKASGQVKEPKVSADRISVEITYGGAASKYALFVHEDMKARHRDGKTAKYLEIPAVAARASFIRGIMERYVRNLR